MGFLGFLYTRILVNTVSSKTGLGSKFFIYCWILFSSEVSDTPLVRNQQSPRHCWFVIGSVCSTTIRHWQCLRSADTKPAASKTSLVLSILQISLKRKKIKPNCLNLETRVSGETDSRQEAAGPKISGFSHFKLTLVLELFLESS